MKDNYKTLPHTWYSISRSEGEQLFIDHVHCVNASGSHHAHLFGSHAAQANPTSQINIQQLLTHSHVTTGNGKLTHIGQLYQNDTQSASTEDLVKFDKERISVINNNQGGRRLHNVKYAQANA